jgi:hypothetical protein
MRDAPVLMKVANPSSQDRTPRRAIVLAVSSAAAPYRASGLVLWHLTDVCCVPIYVCFWQKSGIEGYDNSITFDPCSSYHVCCLGESLSLFAAGIRSELFTLVWTRQWSPNCSKRIRSTDLRDAHRPGALAKVDQCLPEGSRHDFQW